MLKKKIQTCTMALGAIMHELNEDQAAVVRLIRQNLMAVADQIEELEGKLYVPIGEPATAEPAASVPQVAKAARQLDLGKLASGRIVAIIPRDCTGECATCAVANL